MVNTVVYVNMGEEVDAVKGNGNLYKNKEVFYASGVDKLAKFVDKHHREIRVSLFYYNVFAVNVCGRIMVLSLTRSQKVGNIILG